jgi:hypothetical protein
MVKQEKYAGHTCISEGKQEYDDGEGGRRNKEK